jgi:two-component system, cell cycle response regulator
MMGRYDSKEVTVVAPLPTKSPPTVKDVRDAHLIVLSGTNVGQVFDLNKKKNTIGRDEGLEVQILDAGISRRHATIARHVGGGYVLQDAGSRNGTFANNRRIEEEHLLQDGDKIQIGVMTILKFTFGDAPEANYAHAMYEAALRDGLTGIFNRRYFEDRLQSEFSFAVRHGVALALLFLDLDHFKRVNDTQGHLVGDNVLKEFAKVVTRTSRVEDVVCRYGGEEFAVVCRDTDLMKASVLGERIRHDIAAHGFLTEAQLLQITVSVGIAALPDATIQTPESLVAAADEALYQAKERGRNCVIMRRPKT